MSCLRPGPFELRSLCLAALLTVAALAPRPGAAGSLLADDVTGLRSFDQGASVLVLTFTAVKGEQPSGLEDQTVAHFALASLAGVVEDIRLEIEVDGIAPILGPGIFEVYRFGGDGVVSADEWDVGQLFHTFEGVAGGPELLVVDVTGLVRQGLARGAPYLSFRFANPDADRYNVGTLAGLEAPRLTWVPEPTALLLLPLATAALVLRRARSRSEIR